jgi:lipoprotein-releasing system ATP-binding protein
MTETGPIISATNLHKTYKMGRVKVPVLRGLSVSANTGEWVAILGASGSGKSTLLHLLGGLDRPDRANKTTAIRYGDREIGRMSRGEMDRYRATQVGFVFQFYHLLPELRVLENVTVGAMVRHGLLGFMSGKPKINVRAKELLEAFGLGHRLRHRPGELSGGERQRVAIARALINEPRILLADEPTGNLDRKTGDAILDSLADLRDRLGLTIIMVTHDRHVADRADRVIELVDGVVRAGTPADGQTITAG